MSNGPRFGVLCSFPLGCSALHPVVPGVSEGMVVPKEGTVPSDGSAIMGAGDDAGTGRAKSIGLHSHQVLGA